MTSLKCVVGDVDPATRGVTWNAENDTARHDVELGSRNRSGRQCSLMSLSFVFLSLEWVQTPTIESKHGSC